MKQGNKDNIKNNEILREGFCFVLFFFGVGVIRKNDCYKGDSHVKKIGKLTWGSSNF